MLTAPKRIGLFGNFGTGNFGNEASLGSMLQFLRRTQPDSELTCVCYNPEKVQQDHQIPAVLMRLSGDRLRKKFTNRIHALKIVRMFDVLIVPGTGILNDFCVRPIDMPFILFEWCLAARLCGTSIAFVSVGVGPIHHPVSRWLIKRAASMAQYRSYRNKFSKGLMKSLGLNTVNDPIYPDIVFRLSSLRSVTRGPSKAKRGTICVGAMQYHGWRGHLRTDDAIYEGYLGKITEFVLWLLERDYQVRILMGDEWDQRAVDDLRNAVVARKPSLQEAVLITEPAHSGDEVMRQMVDADMVVSSRFHHLVFALMLGKPTISIGYAEYHAELMADMGMGAFCQNTENIKIELLIDQFMELMSNRSYYEAIICDAVTRARERLACQDSVLESQFLDPAWHKHGNSGR